MRKVLVLGSTGMLGSAVTRALQERAHEVITASRSTGIKFDAVNLDTENLLKAAGLQGGDFVVNCVGLTKSRINEASMTSRILAVKLNIDFPDDLARSAEQAGVNVIQAATDCVFSGLAGGYSEGSAHDALDVYGKTKSLGETPSPNVMHLRCSLIGPEIGSSSLFFEWVRQQPVRAQINGYNNHFWNGLSSLAFGKVVSGIIKEDLFKSGVQHLVPSNQVTKDELVRLELAALGRDDAQVTSKKDEHTIDRTLRTNGHDFNEQLFLAAGYEKIPTIQEMVLEACKKLPN
jgi:dTDP-4-dehydrorhamnose reductase